MKKILLSIFILTGFYSVNLAQSLFTETDSIKITGDNLNLTVPEYRGNIQWQYSPDSLFWIDIFEKTSDTLLLDSLTLPGYFRAEIKEGNCDPIHSGISFLKNYLASIKTYPVTNIGLNTATLNLLLEDNGGSEITEAGFYWSSSEENPTGNDNVATAVLVSDNNYSAELTGLTDNTTYYLRSYAINVRGTSMGEIISFTTTLATLPDVVTNDVINIQELSATFQGEVTNEGDNAVTARGFYYSKLDQSPDRNDYVINVGQGLGSFTHTEDGLESNTTYYVRAFATSSAGTSVGSVKSFKTLDDENSQTTGTISYQGKEYKTVKIGQQWWMAENLAYLPSVSKLNEGSTSQAHYYVYKYDGNNVNDAKATNYYKNYGVLYNWEAAKTACPDGWHLPSDNDWEILANFISDDNGGFSKGADGTWTQLGTYLQSKTGWFIASGNDKYQFKAVPGGYRGLGYDAETQNILNFYGYYGMAGWWTSTQYDSANAWGRLTVLDDGSFYRPYRSKDSGASVRCVKD